MKSNQPLAERVRPKNISEFIGQIHLLGEGAPIKNFLDQKTRIVHQRIDVKLQYRDNKFDVPAHCTVCSNHFLNSLLGLLGFE